MSQEPTTLEEALKQIKALKLQLVEGKYENFCPVDVKYRHDELIPFLSFAAEARYCAKVHTALMRGLKKYEKATDQNVKEMEEAENKVSPALIYELEEKITRHDQQAVIMALRGVRSEQSEDAKKKISKELHDYFKGLVSEDTAVKIHPGTTSFDILDTARSMMYKNAMTKVVIPEAKKLLITLVNLAKDYAGKPPESKEKDIGRVQVGRTHGQHTSPTLFSYAIINYALRLEDRIKELERAIGELQGKVSGIVGTHASIGTIVGLENALEFEKYVVEDLCGLKVCPVSHQTVWREKWSDLTHFLVTVDMPIADMANSMRQLQRSEIHEVGERMGEERRGGSSADPSKSNPINFENITGMFELVIASQVSMDHTGISEHQRDLRNSVVQRFEPVHVTCEVYESIKRANKVMNTLAVYPEDMDRNIKQAKKFGTAEALHAVLKAYQHPDPHEAVRKLTKKAMQEDRPLIEVALEEPSIKEYWDEINGEHKLAVTDFESYIGLAHEKTWREIKRILNQN
jgi:adenylosuccinate lyase